MGLRIVIAVLALSGFLAIGFCYWGLETAAGRTTFEGMPGLIPFYAGLGGLGMWGLALVIFAINLWIRRKNR